MDAGEILRARAGRGARDFLIVAHRQPFDGDELVVFHTVLVTATMEDITNPYGKPRCDPAGRVIEVRGPVGHFPEAWKTRAAVSFAEYASVVDVSCVSLSYPAAFQDGPLMMGGACSRDS